MRDVVTASADETALAAARRMATHNVGDLVVVDEQPGALPRPIGIVTDRDLVVRVLAREGLGADTKLADVIQGELITAHEDDDVEVVMTTMREHSIRRVPSSTRTEGFRASSASTTCSTGCTSSSRRRRSFSRGRVASRIRA